MNCLACNGQAESDSLKCVACGNLYHYQCVGMSKAQFISNQHISLKRSWRCPSCTNVTRRNNKDNTPVRKSFAAQPDLNDTTMSCDDASQFTDEPTHKEDVMQIPALSTSAVITNQASITYAQFADLLDEKLKHIKDNLTSEMKATIRSEINRVMETFTSEINHTQTQIKCIEAEKSTLQAGLRSLDRRLAAIERSSRSCNLELHSIPEKKSENLLLILKNLGDKLKVSIPDTFTARRISKFDKTNSRPRNILVTLPSERHRDDVITAFKKYNRLNASNPLNSSDLGVSGEPFRVYVVEHLSAECKELYAEARKFAKERHYKFVWVKYGRILMRKDENSVPIHIKDRESLPKLR
ncbi:hypothetical protein ABMA28_001754 [Loxostege sticticalis]|uniref:PHD-type domain-containing protein n=1 Tax=Loxostege sticticalis TaxID=481309 RepID=A0ABD0T2T1_LOXSC